MHVHPSGHVSTLGFEDCFVFLSFFVVFRFEDVVLMMVYE